MTRGTRVLLSEAEIESWKELFPVGWEVDGASGDDGSLERRGAVVLGSIQVCYSVIVSEKNGSWLRHLW